MNTTYAERKELEVVSKRVFGTVNWYSKYLIKKGVRKSQTEMEASPTGATHKYFHTVESMLEYMLLVETNSKALLEKMKVEATANDLSK